MTETTFPPVVRADETWLRLVRIGAGVATAGLVVLGVVLTFFTTSSGGDYKYAADYWLTAPALPIGVGMVLHALGVHRLQHGCDGRLGAIGLGLFAVCSAVIVVQCMCSLAVAAELEWGPTYVLCSFGSFVGLGLLAAGSWRIGLVSRWMLGVWAPLMLFGSWGGQTLVPWVFGAFLIVFAVILGRRA